MAEPYSLRITHYALRITHYVLQTEGHPYGENICLHAPTPVSDCGQRGKLDKRRAVLVDTHAAQRLGLRIRVSMGNPVRADRLLHGQPRRAYPEFPDTDGDNSCPHLLEVLYMAADAGACPDQLVEVVRREHYHLAGGPLLDRPRHI